MSSLTDKDLTEAKELAEIFEALSEDAKRMARVYLGALRDAQLAAKQKDKKVG